jgi:Mannosyl-glycoprotein endo-beta-N-acetylglucosaminidase
MGPCSRLSVEQIVAWWNKQTRPTYRASVSIDALVTMFVGEGRDEGVRGDIAFAQSIIETGWFSFSGRVPPEANNFAGIGATDGTTDYAVFPDARTGVRAQIQHLRAYADSQATKCALPPLHYACVDPRFDLVTPKGKAPSWNQFGNGVWATDPAYAGKVLGVYEKALTFSGLGLA